MHQISITLGKNVKKFRLARRLSQGDLFKKTSMDTAYISGIECGKRNPTIRNVQKLAHALGVSAAELLK